MQICTGHRCNAFSWQGITRGGPRVHIAYPALARRKSLYMRSTGQGKIPGICNGSRCYRRRLRSPICCSVSSAEADPAGDSLELLGWSEVCSHVANFATTALGRERVQNLSIPSDKKETKLLQAETIAGYTLISELAVRIDLGAISSDTVKIALDRAAKGAVLNESTLLAIAKMLTVTQVTKKSILDSVRQTSSTPISDKVQPVLSVWKSILIPADVVEAIDYAIDEMGDIRDCAKVELRNLRSQYCSLKSRLEKKLGGYGGAVTLRAGRICVGLPSGAELPPNTLVLGTSAKHGLTYTEPQGAVELNNQLAACWGEMKTTEESILWELTNTCVEALLQLTQILEAVIQLDAVRAKAKYTSWIEGTFPDLVPPSMVRKGQAVGNKQPAADDLIQLTNLRHPLLQGHYLLKKGASHRTQKASRSRKKGSGDLDPLTVTPPVPITICLKNEVRALVITGPNTGGKTATLKALGLAVLMAQAGLGVPVESPAHMPYYSAVFADVGDGQSLTSNLSTFSGHMKRIQSIRNCADGDCLVLLDELGTGSNPDEGAALGVSLLKALVKMGPGGALTTVATTHHGLLASLAYGEDSSSFENASVEFDEEKLAPTYRLMMGVPGRSNALVIAARLGMSLDIIEAAKKKVGREQASLSAIIQDLQRAEDASLRESAALQEVLKDLSNTDEEAKKLRSSIAALKRKMANRKRSIYRQVLSNAGQKLTRIEKTIRKGPKQPDLTAKEVEIEQKKPKVETLKSCKTVETNGEWAPTVGDVVFVPKLRMEVEILKIGPGQKLVVKSGSFSMKINTADVVKR